MWLNLGCGSEGRTSGVVNVDRVALPNVDIVHDLDVTPWPFESDAYDRIKAQDVFEHVDDPIGFMTECHRVLKPGGELLIKSPHFRHQDAFTDPTHRRFCTEHTWDYWINGTALFKLHNPAYGGVSYGLRSRQVAAGAIFILLHKI